MVALIALGVIGLLSFTTESALGFGDAVVMTCLGAQFAPLPVALPAFIPLSFLLSTWLLSRNLRFIAWRVLAVELAPPVGAGMAVGLAIFHLPAQRWFLLAFALFVVGLAALELRRGARADGGDVAPLRTRTGIALYVLGGVVHGLYGCGGPLIVYVLKRRLTDKSRFRATLTLLWMVLDVALVVNYATSDLYTPAVQRAMIAIGIAIAPGLALGEYLHARLDAKRFERVVWSLLLVAGAALAIRAALGFAIADAS